jgi:hypothetical protein
MFLAEEVLVVASFDAARSRLASFVEDDELLSTSQVAYGHGIEGTAHVGTAGVSKLVQVQVAQLAESAGSAGLAIRWQAAGPGSSLFPVLDADVRLTSAGEQATLLALTGTYRPQLGSVGEALDRAILRKMAAATVRNFIGRLAAAIADIPDPAQAAVISPGPLQTRLPRTSCYSASA